MIHYAVWNQWISSHDYSDWILTVKKQRMLNHVYLELLAQKLFQTLLMLPERNCCCFGCKQIYRLHLWNYSDGRHQSCSELRSHYSLIWWTTPWILNCFLAELNDLFWQIFSHDLAQLKNCFFLLRIVFWMALLPLLGNQFVSCGMDWSICHFDAFSHTKNFIHNFLRVPAP